MDKFSNMDNSAYARYFHEKLAGSRRKSNVIDEAAEMDEATLQNWMDEFAPNDENEDDYCPFVDEENDFKDEDNEDDGDETTMPPPVIWAINKESMYENIPFTHFVICPVQEGNSPVVKALQEYYNVPSFEKTNRYLPGWEIAMMGSVLFLNALSEDKDGTASADFETLDVCLTKAFNYIFDDAAHDKSVYVDIPYFQAVNEDNFHVDWFTTCEFITGVLEREVNKVRINEDNPNYQIVLNFWDRF